MKFRYTILYVDNVAATIDFYVRAFGARQRLLHESGDYGELDTGSTTLSFSSQSLMKSLGKSPGQPNPSTPTFEIAFETDEVANALQQAMEAGASLVQDLEKMPWGQTTAYVRDNNGFLVELCTPVQG